MYLGALWNKMEYRNADFKEISPFKNPIEFFKILI